MTGDSVTVDAKDDKTTRKGLWIPCSRCGRYLTIEALEGSAIMVCPRTNCKARHRVTVECLAEAQ